MRTENGIPAEETRENEFNFRITVLAPTQIARDGASAAAADVWENK